MTVTRHPLPPDVGLDEPRLLSGGRRDEAEGQSIPDEVPRHLVEAPFTGRHFLQVRASELRQHESIAYIEAELVTRSLTGCVTVQSTPEARSGDTDIEKGRGVPHRVDPGRPLFKGHVRPISEGMKGSRVEIGGNERVVGVAGHE